MNYLFTMLSIIIPFYNEEENLAPLHDELKKKLEEMREAHEIVFVDDGSRDGSAEEVAKLLKKDPQVRLVVHNKRLGKGDALRDALSKAKGDLIVFMDADLQDDPADLPQFLAKIKEGYDFVNGIRVKRKDNPVVKIYSGAANWFLKNFLQSPFTDINCGYKMFRREALDDIVLYGNNFRFLPLAAFYKGKRVGEIPVHNRPRFKGVTKFGIKKLFTGIIDTMTAYFIYRFAEQPLHFFGLIGGVFFLAGFVITFILAVERLFFNVLLYRRPSLLLGILLIIVGLQVVMTGIIGELVVFQHKKLRNRGSQPD